MGNPFVNCYPDTNFHELNLDWIITTVKRLEKRVDTEIESEIIKYVDDHLDRFTLNAVYDEATETLLVSLAR